MFCVTLAAVKGICDKSRHMFSTVKSQFKNLMEKIPVGQYYR